MSGEQFTPMPSALQPRAHANSSARPSSAAPPPPSSAANASSQSSDHPPPHRAGAGRRRTRIKICGITSVELAIAAADAGADAIGLVFVPQSPRYVLPGPAQRIARALPPLMSSIGVFFNPSDPDLQNWRGQWVQMHGQEEEWQLSRVGQNRRIIKGLRFDPVQVRRWERCQHVSALLIDGNDSVEGASFRYESLAEIMPSLATPVILAGGLTAQNVGYAVRAVRPFGVDVSSGVESARGVKEPSLIREFCAAVREADAAAMAQL